MTQLDHILVKYAGFEREVIEFTSAFFKPWCSTCDNVCCKADYCHETLDSAFLALIRHRYPPLAAFSVGRGWLTGTGCALKTGRPPVCYEFLCKRILDSGPMPVYRYAINVLSKLMTHVGRRVAGRRHLVELMDPSDLLAIKSDVFNRRFSQAREAFQVIKAILAHNHMSEEAVACLSRIARPPGGLSIRK